MSDLLKSFKKKLWVRTKYAKKICVNLWDELLIVKATQTNCQGLKNNQLLRILINENIYSTGNCLIDDRLK